MYIAFVLLLLHYRLEAAEVSVFLDGLSLQPCACAINNTRHIPKNVIPTRIQAYNDDVFLTYPRYRKGVPITLGVADITAPHPVTVEPFPSQEMQAAGDCGALQSAADAFLDARGVLWVLDTGVLESMARACCACPPKVVALCARTGAVVRVVELAGVLGPRAAPQYVAAEYDADGSVFFCGTRLRSGQCRLNINPSGVKDAAISWYVSDAEGGSGSVWCVCSGGGGSGGWGGARRLWLPAAATEGACAVLDLASLQDLLLLHCRGSELVFAVHTALLRAGQFADALTTVGPAPAAAHLVFLGTDLLHTVYYRLEGHGEVFSWDTRAARRRVAARAAEGAARAQLTATSVAVRGERAALALAADFGAYAARRVGCAGAEARLFSLH